MAQTLGFGDLQNQGQNIQNEDQEQKTNQPDIGSAPISTPSSSTAGSKPGDQYKPAAYSQKGQGTGYTNIQKIVQANQPQQLQQAVAGNVQQQVQQGVGNIGQAQQQFAQQTAANQSNTAENQQLVQNILNDPTKYSNPVANSGNVIGTPSNAAPAQPVANINPNVYGTNTPVGQQGSLFTKLISGQYGGPTGLANQDQLQAQAQALYQMGQGLGTSGGRTSVLQNIVGSPQYSQGQQRLDSLLLGQGNQQDLTQARRQALGVQDVLSRQAGGAAEQAKGQTSQAQAFGQDIQGQLGQTVSSADTALQKQATDAQTTRDAQYQKMLADLKSGNITQEEADMFGLTSGQNVYNTLNDPSKFLAESGLKANAQNIAGSQDYAKMQALQQLAGSYSPQQAQDVFKQYNDPTQAGKFAADTAVTGDKTAFQNALTSTSNEYNAKLKPAQDSYNVAKDMQRLVDIMRNKNGTPEAGEAQRELYDKYPGVRGGSLYQTFDYVAALLADKQQKLKDTQNILQQAYGNPNTINVVPNQQAGQQQPVITDLGLEKSPIVR